MKKANYIIITLAVALVLTVVGTGCNKTERWEYKIEGIKSARNSDFEEQLNNHGKDGWEFISYQHGDLFFKRRLP